MDLYEYQARDLFERHGVPVLPGIVATTPDEARAAATALATPVVVVKAQVKAGGRGKVGGVRLARDPEEAAARASGILGMDIKGHTVRQVMVTAGADIAEEYYVSLLVDRSSRGYLAMCSKEGGVDIETLAAERPDTLAKVGIDPLVGLDDEAAGELLERAGFGTKLAVLIAPVLKRLWEVFDQEDATLVEVNPLARTGDGRIVALDGKITLDDNASFRHGRAGLPDDFASDPLEVRAGELGLNYVKLDGSVGVIGNGAGLVMSTLDVVAGAGADLPGWPRPANFLDIGGGASAAVMANGLGIILSDPQVRCVFVNIFGGITACNEVANGIVAAVTALGDRADCPIVVRLDGNAVGVGRAILAEFAHPMVTVVETMDEAARMAAELAARDTQED